MTLQEAKDFINFNIKEGIWSEDQFENMTDQELVEFAERNEALADAYWDSLQDTL